MKLAKTMMMTAAAVVLSTAAMAEGNYGTTSDMNKRSANQMGLSADSGINADADNGNYSDVSPAAGVEATTQTNTSVSASQLDSNTIEQIQESLANEGHSITADGVWGPRTAAALRQFQQDKGLTASGVVDSETLAALDVNVNTGM